MNDAGKILSSAWVAKMKKEVEDPKQWKTWDKSKQKKWAEEYQKTALKAFEIVLANANETLGKVNAVKDSCKSAMDGLEKIVDGLRKKNEPLSDSDRKWIEKSKSTIEGSEKAVNSLTKAFSDHSPMAGREDFFGPALDAKAITKDVVAKIKAMRKQGIDVGNEFGKSGPAIKRLEEYRKRWTALTAEINGLEKQRAGKLQDWAADVNNRLKEFANSQAKWEDDMRTTVGKISRNMEGLVGKIEATDVKGFGPSMLKAIKLKVSSKAKEQEELDQSGLKLYIKLLEDFLKSAKGTLKTRLTEFQSLTASLKDAGPYADPQRKTLEGLGKKLVEQKKTIDELDKSAQQALVAAKG